MAPNEKDRRKEILEAALHCFLERGYLATSIADIRKRSGASTGSIYHFFANKGALARALLEQAVAGWSGASAAALETDAKPEAAIKAAVGGLVTWGLANPALLRFMDEIRTLGDNNPEFAEVRQLFAQGRTLGESQYRRFTDQGAVRPLPFSVAHSLMLGPVYNYLRLVSAGDPPAPGAAELLAAAAWNSVKA